MIMKKSSMCLSNILFLMIAMQSPLLIMADYLDIGVCYGMQGNDLPSATDVVALYKQYGIGRMRLFDPNHMVLEALQGSNIKVALGVRNEDIQSISSSQDAANSWFESNMQPYVSKVNFIFIVVGNEAVPGIYADSVAPAMQNILNVLRNHNLHDTIRVTTAVSQEVFQNTYPPSATEFHPRAFGPVVEILKVLSGQGASMLMTNLYPYFAYASDPGNVSLPYAQFTSPEPVVHDGNLVYFNLFDAMLDGVYWAMEKAGFADIGVAVSESGWPSAENGDITTPELASIYNRNFVRHILSMAGSPKRPNTHIEAFIFAMFNENQKPPGVEQHWGLFYPNKEPIYSVFSNQ